MTTPQDSKRPSGNTGRMKEDRLGRQDWLEAGLNILAQTGPGGLRIDGVCKAMNVTKGSFYWHFQDRQDFLGSLFLYWRDRETTSLIQYVEATYTAPRDRIWHVVEFVTLGNYDVATEVTMRQWGQSDPTIREALKHVDEERLGFFTRQFGAAGFGAEDANLRAISVYSFTLSCGYMLTGEDRDALEKRLRASLDLLFRAP